MAQDDGNSVEQKTVEEAGAKEEVSCTAISLCALRSPVVRERRRTNLSARDFHCPVLRKLMMAHQVGKRKREVEYLIVICSDSDSEIAVASHSLRHTLAVRPELTFFLTPPGCEERAGTCRSPLV